MSVKLEGKMKIRTEPTLVLLFSAFCLLADANPEVPVVQTKLGDLSGQYLTVKDTDSAVFAYLGIPFAKPPVGPGLRLSAPQPVAGWEGVRDATKQPPMCVQNVQIMKDLLESFGGLEVDIPDISEDCLYLNIYTPANRAPGAKLPVMVWIHGGGFSMGSASMCDGSALAAYQNVVVVLIQYRLGPLGFLSTGDEHMPGNYGLMDQVEALKWVQEHIHNFGGDANSVTIFGESAGGVSVSLLLISPLAKGLFHRAIAESGTALITTITEGNPLPVMQAVANRSECSLESTEKMADCMKNVDLDVILPLLGDPSLMYTVTTDGFFLEKPLIESFENHEVHQVPFMTGVTDDEGGWLLPRFLAPENWTEGVDQEALSNFLTLFYPDPKDAARDWIVEEYTGTGEDRIQNRNGYTELMGDMFFNVAAVRTANFHRDAGVPVYVYEYQHAPLLMSKGRPSFVRSDHGDDLFTVFGLCFTTAHAKIPEQCPEEEKEFSKIVMSYWGNFARTGSPNGDDLAYWPKYGEEEGYLIIRLKEQVVSHHLKKNHFTFWTQTLPQKIQEQKTKMTHAEL